MISGFSGRCGAGSWRKIRLKHKRKRKQNGITKEDKNAESRKIF
ncbi:hypothetical protein HMPREF1986_01073 [Oribacterium sp. oral taxon 078 str. F0263]|nr:hypothetical protein HMPREF1986_01073 [Oribacterium sp. oral taxon 078 str. F0263]